MLWRRYAWTRVAWPSVAWRRDAWVNTCWRRHTSYFNSANLNYEVLSRKVQKFHRQDSHPPHMIKDYIIANRRLQGINKQLDPQYKFSAAPKHGLDLVLNVASTNLEHELWDFLRIYWTQAVENDDVVKAYVLTCTGADMSRAIALVEANYHHQKHESTFIGSAPKTELVSLLLRKLLENNDYQNSFKLLDITVSSIHSISRRKNTVFKQFGACAGILAASLAARLLLDSMDICTLGPDLILSLTSAAILTGLGFLGMKSVDLPRVSWRPHTSLLYRYTHHEEMISLNRLVTYFEEHHEINVKNFHVSRVRTWANSSSFQENDYELILPPSHGSQLASPQVQVPDKQYESMVQYVKSELLQRKMLWNPLNEEKMFLEFWLNHGENFEWVEPDQDPAEMRILHDT